MSVTDGDRQRAEVVIRAWFDEAGASDYGNLPDVIAQALADERERARAPFLALAERWESAGLGPTQPILRSAAEYIRRAAEDSQ